jgi:hypothetical protein
LVALFVILERVRCRNQEEKREKKDEIKEKKNESLEPCHHHTLLEKKSHT